MSSGESDSGLMKTAHCAINCKESMSFALNSSSTMKNSGTAKKHQRSPLINRTYYYRQLCCHKIVEKSLVQYKRNTASVQLLLLGAGLDNSYEKYDVNCFAIDFESIISDRHQSCSRSKLISADLRNVVQLHKALIDSDFSFDCPTIVVVEVVLCYLTKIEISNLITFIQRTISKVTMVIYDPVIPKTLYHSFSNSLLSGFESNQAPIKHGIKSRREYEQLLKEGGWVSVTTYNIQMALSSLFTLEERKMNVTAEPFDEFAALSLLNQCYMLAIASSESMISSDTSDGRDAGVIKDSATIASLDEIYTRLANVIPGLCGGPIRIRLCNAMSRSFDDDSTKLVSLYTNCFKEYIDKYPAVKKFTKKAAKDISKRIQLFSDPSGSGFWTIECGDRLLGCIALRGRFQSYQDHKDQIDEICYMCVHSSVRRCGIAKLLLYQAMKHSSNVNKSIRLDLSVLADLTAAREFYRSMGFVEQLDEKCGTAVGKNECRIVHMIRAL